MWPDLTARIQEAFLRHRALQCGFCTPGMILAILGALLDQDRSRDVESVLRGNLCRCSGYVGIRQAAEEACREQ